MLRSSHSPCHQARKPRIAQGTHKARTSHRRLPAEMQLVLVNRAKTCRAVNSKHPIRTDKAPRNLGRIRKRARTNPVRPGGHRTDNRRPISPLKIRSPRNLDKRSQHNLDKRSQRNLGRLSLRKRVVRQLSKPSPASRGNPPKANLDKRSHPNLGKCSLPNLGKCSHLNLGRIRPINLDKLSQGRVSLLQVVQDRVRANPAMAKVHRARASKAVPLLAPLRIHSAQPERPR